MGGLIDFVRCDRCGKTIPYMGDVCPHCQSDKTAAKKSFDEAQAKAKKELSAMAPGCLIGVGTFIGVALGAAAIVALFGGSRETSQVVSTVASIAAVVAVFFYRNRAELEKRTAPGVMGCANCKAPIPFNPGHRGRGISCPTCGALNQVADS